jgi:glycerophosphoryl diester phosphodiesterase
MGEMADLYVQQMIESLDFSEHDYPDEEIAARIHVHLARYKKTGICKIGWVTKKGDRILISDMSIKHLRNCRNKLAKELWRSESDNEMLRVLDYELQKRLEMAKKSDSYYDPALSWNDEGQIEHTKDNTEELFRFFEHNPYGMNNDRGDAFIASLAKWFEDKGELTPNQFKAIAKMYQYQCNLAGAADAYHEDRGL